MLTTNFLKTRTSTRDFLDKTLTEEDKKKVFEFINEETEKIGKNDVNFLLSTDGDAIYNSLSGIAGYGGVMIKAPVYIALNTLNTEKKSFVLGSYGMEELITKLNSIGLGTCWITVTDVEATVKKSAFNFTDGDVNHLLAVGYPVDTEVREHRYDDRIGITDLVFIDDFNHKASVDELEQRGLADLFTYARFAPSTKNEQPWRFIIKGDTIELYIEDYKGNMNLIDAGIIMYYIDELTKSFANESKWEIDPQLNNDKYQFIAKKVL
jgi:nitroreductase